VVEIDGLGLFRPTRTGGYEFVAKTTPKVFLAYVEEDREAVLKLFAGLQAHGMDPWLDRRKLMPGQNWPRSIERAIEVSDFFLACLSHRSVAKPGRFQSELRYALDCASRLPLEEVYFIPVRLDRCDVPARIAREIQYVDLFPDWDRGLNRVIRVIRQQLRRRRSNRAPGG